MALWPEESYGPIEMCSTPRRIECRLLRLKLGERRTSCDNDDDAQETAAVVDRNVYYSLAMLSSDRD